MKNTTLPPKRMAPLTLTDVSSKFGAPMGRSQWLPKNPAAGGKLRLVRLHLNSGAYDSGGAYWGFPNDLWHAEGDLDGEQERTRLFLRAGSRAQAKAEIKKQFPNVRFYR